MTTMQLARKICTAVRDAGGRGFLVGGMVRDRLLQLPSKDLDLEVYGIEPEALKSLLQAFGQVRLIGQRFAVLHLHSAEGDAEISLPRTESKTGPGHKGFAVHANPHLTPREASRRRDFTVNAILEDPLTGEVLDPWNGRRDLEQGLLRHVSSAFAEDPLRVLRAARFVARFGWRLHPKTAALCRSLNLEELPKERVVQEWQKILLGAFPGQALLALEQCGALRFFPELAALRGVPQDPIWHPEGDVLQHTALCLQAAVACREQMEHPWLEMLAVLCHDLGKASNTEFQRGRWRSAGHDVAGEIPARHLLQRINQETDVVEPVVALVREHLRPSQLYSARERVGDAAIRRLATRVSIPALCRVAWADAAGRSQDLPNPWPPAAWLLKRAAALGVEKRPPQNLLRGRDLLELGWQPGPEMGRILKQAFELQLDGKIKNREDALAWLGQQVPG